jgi:hypothetical protein
LVFLNAVHQGPKGKVGEAAEAAYARLAFNAWDNAARHVRSALQTQPAHRASLVRFLGSPPPS